MFNPNQSEQVTMGMPQQPQGYNPYMMGQPAGYQYNGYQQQQVPKVQSTLTDEEYQSLLQNQSKFNLSLTQEEVTRARCNHRTPDGSADTLEWDQTTGVAYCRVCKYTFKPVDENISFDDLKQATDTIINILQTIKILYVDLPVNAFREYFQIIPLIEKIPELFGFAVKNSLRYDSATWNLNNRSAGAVAMLNQIQQMFGGNMMGMPQPGMMNPGMGQPQMGYPGAAPQQFVTPQGVSNGFGVNPANPVNPGTPYQPQNTGFQYTPNQPVQQAVQGSQQQGNGVTITAPEAPAADQASQPTETVVQNVSV